MHACRLCAGSISESWTSKDAKSAEGLSIGLCSQCGLVSQLALPSDEDLRIYYSHHYREDYKSTHSPKLKYVQRAGRTALDRLEFMKRAGIVPQGKRLLDIGAGGGEFCYMAQRAGFSARGIEPHQGYSDFARQAYDIEVRTCGIADLDDRQADVVTLFHVFEHLAHPRDVMSKIWHLLTDGGQLVIEVPNLHQADASPHNVYFKAHLFYYSQFSLMAAASPYFEPLHTEDHGNLFMAFRKRAVPLSDMHLPSAAQVAHTRKRLQQKGWLEYLFVGGGLMKAPKRIEQSIAEALLPSVSPRDMLDGVWLLKQRRPTGYLALGALLGAAILLEACC
jgi:SAM-dependent methyltransferase